MAATPSATSVRRLRVRAHTRSRASRASRSRVDHRDHVVRKVTLDYARTEGPRCAQVFARASGRGFPTAWRGGRGEGFRLRGAENGRGAGRGRVENMGVGGSLKKKKRT